MRQCLEKSKVGLFIISMYGRMNGYRTRSHADVGACLSLSDVPVVWNKNVRLRLGSMMDFVSEGDGSIGLRSRFVAASFGRSQKGGVCD